MNQWSRKDAEAHFDEVVTAARQHPQMVTEAGKPAVVVVDAGEFERLVGKPLPARPMKNGKEMTFAEHLLAMPWKEGFEIERAPREPRDIDL